MESVLSADWIARAWPEAAGSETIARGPKPAEPDDLSMFEEVDWEELELLAA